MGGDLGPPSPVICKSHTVRPLIKATPWTFSNSFTSKNSDSYRSSMASNDLSVRLNTLNMRQLDFNIIFQPPKEATSYLAFVIIKKWDH